jgi:Thiamine pyrophosphate enzyme, N-terminal TPP binding domain
MDVSEFVWQRLSAWGLKRVYGYPGDGVGGLDVALEKAKDRMKYVQVRHEEMAASMGLRACKVHRTGRALLRDIGSGRHPSAQRPVRRQDGPS